MMNIWMIPYSTQASFRSLQEQHHLKPTPLHQLHRRRIRSAAHKSAVRAHFAAALYAGSCRYLSVSISVSVSVIMISVWMHLNSLPNNGNNPQLANILLSFCVLSYVI